MIHAYILVIMQPGFSNKAVDEITKQEKVVKTSVIAGEYDIIIRVNVKTLHELHELTMIFHKIKGVKKTITSLIEKELSI